jgi:initiation factor 1A
MVKNVHGGNKHKSQARKNTVKTTNKLRIAEDEGELYAIVTKILGNGMFYAHCIDNIQRLAYIRGKFSGRGKRDNSIEVGRWVLVGEREWDIGTSDKTKKLKCDLLEVYNDLDKEKLIDTISMNWSILNNQDITKIKDSSEQSDICFTTEREEETNKLIEEIRTNKSKAIELKLGNENDYDVNNQTDWINDI